MWAIMMVAMMLPPAAPMTLLYAKVTSQPHGSESVLAPASVMAGTYLLLWAGFSAVAALLQWGLSESGLISGAAMVPGDARVAGGLLSAAGLYQLTPLKQVCLSNCGSPFSFLTSHWRPGYVRRDAAGICARTVLSGLLQDDHGAAVRGWGDESRLGCRAGDDRVGRKVAPFGERIGHGAGVILMSGFF